MREEKVHIQEIRAQRYLNEIETTIELQLTDSSGKPIPGMVLLVGEDRSIIENLRSAFGVERLKELKGKDATIVRKNEDEPYSFKPVGIGGPKGYLVKGRFGPSKFYTADEVKKAVHDLDLEPDPQKNSFSVEKDPFDWMNKITFPSRYREVGREFE